jgi:hypothetical protein
MLPLRSMLVAAVLLLTASARAEQLDDDAPLAPVPGPDHGKMATEDATPVGAGAIEVEAAYSPTLTSQGSGSFEPSAHGHAHAFSLAMVYGLTEHLDVKVASGFGYAMDRSDVAGPTRGSGVTDLALGARWRFLANAEQALDLALVTTVVAPTGREEAIDALGLTQGFWSVRNALVASKDWGQATANAELALTLPVGGGAEDLEGGACANLAFGYAFAPWFQGIAEVNYDAVRDATTQQRLAVTAGVNMTTQSGRGLLLGVQQAVWGRNVAQTTTGLVALKTAF